MSTKRGIWAVALAAALLFGTLQSAFAQTAISDETEASDVVVLLDVSQSVLPYFHDITDYVVGPVVKNYLRLGDTFHLLSFGETTQVEIAQRISTEEDVKSVLARLYLLYPLARNTDLVSAFSYLSQYLSDLPETRSKVVIIITDGIHNPSQKSPAFGLSADQANAEIEVTASRIKRNGWPVHVIKVPFSAERAAAEAAPATTSGSAAQAGAAAQGQAQKSAQGQAPKGGAAAGKAGEGQSSQPGSQGQYLDTIAKSLDASVTDYKPEEKGTTAQKSLSLPEVVFPGQLGKKGYTFSFPLKVHNSSDSEVGLELEKVMAEGSDILAKKSFLSLPAGWSATMNISVALPPSMKAGDKNLGVDLYFADGLRVSPSHGTLSFTLAPSPLASLFKSGSRVILFIILVALGLAAVLVLIALLRRAPRQAAAPIVAAVRESAEAAKRRGAAPSTAQTPTPSAAQATQQPLRPAQAGRRPFAAPSTVPGETIAETPLSGRPSQLPLPKPQAPAKAGKKAPAFQAESGAAAAPTYAPRIARPGSIQLELRVSEQNPHIGMRNVQTVHAGSSRSVGGGRSDFLVFLVPVPHRAAEIHFDGETCTFVPLKPELFPELGGQPLADCVGKDIPMLSRKGYRMVLRFSKYEAPANKINRLLHCIETPGFFQGLDC